MHVSQDALLAARLAGVSAAVQALMREAIEDGYDGLNIEASASAGQIVIDLQYTKDGVAMGGQDL